MEEASAAGSLQGAARRKHRARRNQPAERREAPGSVRLRRLRAAAVHLGDEIRVWHRLAELLHLHSRPLRPSARLFPHTPPPPTPRHHPPPPPHPTSLPPP